MADTPATAPADAPEPPHPTRASTAVAEAPDQATDSAEPTGDPKPSVKPAEPHIGEQRATTGLPRNAATAAPAQHAQAQDGPPHQVPSARLSGYQAEAAKLLSGALTGRRKRRGAPETPAADPVAEDQAGKTSRPAKKGQAKPAK